MSLIIEFIRDIFLYIYKMFKFTARKHFQCYNEVKVIILSQQGGIYMKSCSKCNCKIDLLTRLKTLGNECVRIKCEQCGTVYEVESKGVVKIINLLSFFMIFLYDIRVKRSKLRSCLHDKVFDFGIRVT